MENFSIDKLIMFGFDYKKSPIEIREKVAFTNDNLETAYKKLLFDAKLKEFSVLSTCNRSEIYAIVDDAKSGEEYLKDFYSEFFNIEKEKLADYISVRRGKSCVQHIFEVTCGFQSLVFGEDQILGQVKDCYLKSLEYDSSGKILNRLFVESISTAKKVKTQTDICKNLVSISSIGIKLLEKNLGCIADKTALLIGVGKMTRIAIQNLISRQIRQIYLANRTRKRAETLAQEYNEIICVDFKDRYKFIENVDIVISSTGASNYVLQLNKFKESYRNTPLYVLDIAMPRDVDPQIDTIPGVKIYKIDDLEKIAEENTQKRQSTKKKGLKILNHDVRKFTNWVNELKLINIIMSIQENSKIVMGEELDTLKEKLDGIDEKQMEIIEKAFYNYAKIFTHKPIAELKEFIKDNPRYDDSINKELKDS